MTPRRRPHGYQIIAHEKTFFKVLDLLDRLPRGRLLDVPSGEGALSVSAREMGFQVEAGDIDPRFFKVPEARCHRIDMNRRMPLPDEGFDVVVSIEGIEHLEDPFEFIRECHRVLTWKGTLILSTPNILNLASRFKYLLSGFFSLCPGPINEFSHLPVFDHINPMTYYQIRYALHTNGFEIVGAHTDLWRRSCFPFLLLYPMLRLYSVRTMRKETDPRQRKANREIRRVMNGFDLLLGRTLILEARKVREKGVLVTDASEVGSVA